MSTILNANALENEAIYIMREVAAQFEKPVLLFSGGKDSITLVRLRKKLFIQQKFLFLLCMLIQGTIFQKQLTLEISLCKELGVELIVRNVQDNIDSGKVQEESGKYASRNMLQTETF